MVIFGVIELLIINNFYSTRRIFIFCHLKNKSRDYESLQSKSFSLCLRIRI